MSTLPIGAEFGAYQIVRHIGGGGMAQIYLAKTRGLAGFEKYLALKVINTDLADDGRFIQMLIDEAKLTVGLNHVNIAQVFDLGKAGGIYYIAMEFVDGIDVLELVNGLHSMGEKVAIEAAAYIGMQISNGLHYAHSRKDLEGYPLNIVHRDISPQNILVSWEGEVKLVDFGIAKAAGLQSKTQAGMIKGKVHYMAPEQARGKPADLRSDIFSTGIVIWEMLTSKMVYSGENIKLLVEQVRKAAIPPPSTYRPEVTPELDAIVMKAMSRRPDDRYQSAHLLLVQLTQYLSDAHPDYSSVSLADLVNRVLRDKDQELKSPDLHLSKDDMIQDHHSIISQAGVLEPDLSAMGGKARLMVDTEQGRLMHTLTDELILGRAGQLTIPDARISRRHARIFQQDADFYVEDMGSSNGTFVNSEKIDHPVRLRDKDIIRLGSHQVHFLASPTLPMPPSLPLKTSRPRLVISCNDNVLEQILDQELLLEYEVTVGAARLRGPAGKVVRKKDGYWLEPLSSRDPVMVEGKEARKPFRLSQGNTFSVGSFIFQLQQD